MKKNYINPQVAIHRIDIEQMIAESHLERGAASESGGNNAEVKGVANRGNNSNPVVWEDWE